MVSILGSVFWRHTSILVAHMTETTPQITSARAAPPFIMEASTLRWIFHSATNGLKLALLKAGGHVYIDCTECNTWLEGRHMAPKPLNTVT